MTRAEQFKLAIAIALAAIVVALAIWWHWLRPISGNTEWSEALKEMQVAAAEIGATPVLEGYCEDLLNPLTWSSPPCTVGYRLDTDIPPPYFVYLSLRRPSQDPSVAYSRVNCDTGEWWLLADELFYTSEDIADALGREPSREAGDFLRLDKSTLDGVFSLLPAINMPEESRAALCPSER